MLNYFYNAGLVLTLDSYKKLLNNIALDIPAILTLFVTDKIHVFKEEGVVAFKYKDCFLDDGDGLNSLIDQLEKLDPGTYKLIVLYDTEEVEPLVQGTYNTGVGTHIDGNEVTIYQILSNDAKLTFEGWYG